MRFEKEKVEIKLNEKAEITRKGKEKLFFEFDNFLKFSSRSCDILSTKACLNFYSKLLFDFILIASSQKKYRYYA